jgi:lantibiotic leader peptide-processing serine protease
MSLTRTLTGIVSFTLLSCSTIAYSPRIKHSYKKQSHTAGKQIVVAVIDTGFDESRMNYNFLCKTGHKDFTGKGLNDTHGHGSHISGLIDQYAKGVVMHGSDPSELRIAAQRLKSTEVNYCQIIIKYYSEGFSASDNISNTISSFRWAIDHGADIINYSGGGNAPSLKEFAVVEEALDRGITVVVAAGNDKRDIGGYYMSEVVNGKDIPYEIRSDIRYYPAAYDPRIVVVGNNKSDGERSARSNYGKIVRNWELGDDVLSYCNDGKYCFFTGTSQATAIKTGKIVHDMLLRH